jgi:hypothetical protein
MIALSAGDGDGLDSAMSIDQYLKNGYGGEELRLRVMKAMGAILTSEITETSMVQEDIWHRYMERSIKFLGSLCNRLES